MKFVFGFVIGVLTLVGAFITGLFAGRIEVIPRHNPRSPYYRRSYFPSMGRINYESVTQKEETPSL